MANRKKLLKKYQPSTSLRHLYLQKPISLIVTVTVLMILPWLGFLPLQHPIEIHQANVVSEMIAQKSWILPPTVNEGIINSGPLHYWLIGLNTLIFGDITPFALRFPSAIAFIAIVGLFLFFIAKRLKFQPTFISIFMLITSLGFHYEGMLGSPQMIFAALVIAILMLMFRWEEKDHLEMLPIAIPLLMSFAFLTRGIMGILLPLLIFFTYLLILNKYKKRIVIKAILYPFIASLYIPTIWILMAYEKGGAEFINQLLTSNLPYFFQDGQEGLKLFGALGQGYKAVWFLLIGFMPWTIFFLFSLFGLNRKSITLHNFQERFRHKLHTYGRLRLFAFTVIISMLIISLFNYRFDNSYLIVVYPFISIFLGHYTLYFMEYRTKLMRIFATFIVVISSVLFIPIVGSLIDNKIVEQILSILPNSLENTFGCLNQIDSLIPLWINIILIITVAICIGTLIYQLRRKINIKMLYATLALILAWYLLLDTSSISSFYSMRKNSKIYIEDVRPRVKMNDLQVMP